MSSPVRTTPALVEAVLTNDWDGESSLTPFIAAASAIVDRIKTCAAAKGLTLSAIELELVERWLAAHYYCQTDQPYASKSTAGANASFQGKTEKSIEGTKYGQAALNIDYSGCLMAISRRAFASMGWLGKPASQQVPIDQRN